MHLSDVLALAAMAVSSFVYIAWLRRVTNYDAYVGRPSWRFLRSGGVAVASRRQPQPTARWLATRVAMAAGLAALVLPLALQAVAPDGSGGMAAHLPPGWAAVVTTAGWAGLIAGNAWLYRIMRSGPEPDTRGWRYRG